jgi:fructose-specific phosphotransferase system IIC component
MMESLKKLRQYLLTGVGDHAPHGGPIVIAVADHKLMYVIAILAGTGVTAFLANAAKKFANRKVPEVGVK